MVEEIAQQHRVWKNVPRPTVEFTSTICVIFLSLAAGLAGFDQRWDLFRRFSTSVERKKYENWGLYRLHIMFMRVSRRARAHDSRHGNHSIRIGNNEDHLFYFFISQAVMMRYMQNEEMAFHVIE